MRAGFWLSGVAILAIVLAGCSSSDDGPRYSDAKIVDKLNLKPSEHGYTVNGSFFCEVEKKLLHNADEVSAAADRDKGGYVTTSSQGNVGVIGVPIYQPDCKAKVEKKLNKLDPKPKDD